MGGTADRIKGEIKEAVGRETDDKDLQREGQADRVGGQVKDAADKASDKLDDLVDRGKSRFAR